jgi:hypothetical protein
MRLDDRYNVKVRRHNDRDGNVLDFHIKATCVRCEAQHESDRSPFWVMQWIRWHKWWCRGSR